MKIFGFNITRNKEKPQKRSFEGAKLNRLNQDFMSKMIRTNEDIKNNYNVLVARSEELAKNNADYRKWLRMCQRNIVGPFGIKLNMQAKLANGELDNYGNSLLEEHFIKFQKFGQVTTNKRHSGRSLDKLIVRSWRTTGEVLIRVVKGYDNEYRLAYQLLDPKSLDVNLNRQRTPYQNKIEMGIEYNEWDVAIAYHFKCGQADSYYGYDPVYSSNPNSTHKRIDASEIRHFYEIEFPNQKRGFPFGQAAMQNIYSLGGYFYTELVAADVSSRKMGFYIPPTGEEAETKDDEGNPVTREIEITEEAEPGSLGELPPGWDFKTWDPQHPQQNFPYFVKSQKRNVANGLDVAYNIFGNDLEGVNFSSIRQGIIDERDAWMDDQQTFIEQWKDLQFQDFLGVFLLSPFSPYAQSAYQRLLDGLKLQPRRWQWVDPLKDAQAALLLMALGGKAPQTIADELGSDFDDNMVLIEKALPQFENIQKIISAINQVKKVVDDSVSNNKDKKSNSEKENEDKDE
jgi:lambda family phage portal protein